MLSNKWTFSLTSLVVILALALVVPSAMAAEFTVGLSVGPDVDISSPDGIQAAYGQDADIDIKIATGAVVQIANTRGIRLPFLLVKLLKQPREQQQHLSS